MGAAPVDALALGALREHVVGAVRAVFQAVADALLVGLVERAVAGGAAGPGCEGGCEAAQYVAQLLVGVVAVDVRAGEQFAAAQQAAVAGEQDASFGGGAGGEGGVADVLVLVGGVDAEQAQAAGEGAEVDVEEEAEGAPGTCWGRSTPNTSTFWPSWGT